MRGPFWLLTRGVTEVFSWWTRPGGDTHMTPSRAAVLLLPVLLLLAGCPPPPSQGTVFQEIGPRGRDTPPSLRRRAPGAGGRPRQGGATHHHPRGGPGEPDARGHAAEQQGVLPRSREPEVPRARRAGASVRRGAPPERHRCERRARVQREAGPKKESLCLAARVEEPRKQRTERVDGGGLLRRTFALDSETPPHRRSRPSTARPRRRLSGGVSVELYSGLKASLAVVPAVPSFRPPPTT